MFRKKRIEKWKCAELQYSTHNNLQAQRNQRCDGNRWLSTGRRKGISRCCFALYCPGASSCPGTRLPPASASGKLPPTATRTGRVVTHLLPSGCIMHAASMQSVPSQHEKVRSEKGNPFSAPVRHGDDVAGPGPDVQCGVSRCLA